MIRHSSIDELAPSIEAWTSLRTQGGVHDGEGMDYRKFRCIPASPPEAKFLRRYVTLREALLRLRVESPNNYPAQKPFIRAGCSAVLTGLGSYPWKYAAAEESLHKWCWDILSANGFVKGVKPWPSIADHRPQVAVAAELMILVSRLIIAYADPHRFFKEIAPQAAPQDFDTTRLSQPLWLGHTIWRWGLGALLNDDVRRAFEAATPDQLIEILGQAEGREKYREGNPKGSGKGKPKKKRVDATGLKVRAKTRAKQIEATERLDRGGMKRAIEEIAKAEKLTPAAIRKRITRASKK
jgi:hypothetical protein